MDSPVSTRMRKVTMTDVARMAGCSQATVSFVLNNVPDIKISADTKNKVLKAARVLKYGVTSLNARSGLNAAHSIGFIVDQLATSPESVNAIEGARQASWQDSTVILTAQTMGVAAMEEAVVKTMLHAGVSGLVYMSIFTRQVILPRALLLLPIPVVLLNCYTDAGEFPAIVPDEVEGGKRATQALLKRGRTRIATITGEPFMEASQQRLQGYRVALQTAGYRVDGDIIVEGNWSPTSGYDATKKLLAMRHPPDGIFCQNDKMASGCFEAMREAGLSIGADMSVIGYDDDELCRHLRPQLSTIVLPHREMGSWAIHMLNSEAGKFPTSMHRAHNCEKAECTLIMRNSI